MDAHGADDEIRVEGLDPPIETPRLRGKVIARASMHDLLDELSSDLTAHALNCVREFGDFHLALSGGQTPMPFYEQLMYDPRYRAIPWRRTHLWMVDERCVGFEDERSNFGRIKEVIVDHSDIPPEQVHPMIAMAPGAGERYERELRETLGWRQKGHDRLDFVLLGVGPDGHTASIFPGSPALDVHAARAALHAHDAHDQCRALRRAARDRRRQARGARPRRRRRKPAGAPGRRRPPRCRRAAVVSRPRRRRREIGVTQAGIRLPRFREERLQDRARRERVAQLLLLAVGAPRARHALVCLEAREPLVVEVHR